jgi:hypothetical protein
MEGGSVHGQKKCNELAWCYFNVEGMYLMVLMKCFNLYFFGKINLQSLSLDVCRDLPWGLLAMVLQPHPSGKKVKRTRAIISAVLWESC